MSGTAPFAVKAIEIMEPDRNLDHAQPTIIANDSMQTTNSSWLETPRQ
jgi:hypothetical protein